MDQPGCMRRYDANTYSHTHSYSNPDTNSNAYPYPDSHTNADRKLHIAGRRFLGCVR